MFERLIDLLVELLKGIQPCCIILEYQMAVRLRLGRFHSVLGPGFHWIIPFWIDDVIHDHVIPRTERLPAMSTTTLDGKAIGFEGVITYKISDIRKALLEVEAIRDAIIDSCAGTIGATLSESTWDDIWHGKASEQLFQACRKKGWRWGIEIMAVQLAGVSLTKTLRIMQSGTLAHHGHISPG